MLLARCLVESGVTFVTVRVGGWDDHNQIEKGMQNIGPTYDQDVVALVADIYEQDLDKGVLVVAMGEFGYNYWNPVVAYESGRSSAVPPRTAKLRKMRLIGQRTC